MVTGLVTFFGIVNGVCMGLAGGLLGVTSYVGYKKKKLHQEK